MWTVLQSRAEAWASKLADHFRYRDQSVSAADAAPEHQFQAEAEDVSQAVVPVHQFPVEDAVAQSADRCQYRDQSASAKAVPAVLPFQDAVEDE